MSQQETAARARARATLTSDQSSLGTEATPNISETRIQGPSTRIASRWRVSAGGGTVK